jgi:hypothetical protein
MLVCIAPTAGVETPAPVEVPPDETPAPVEGPGDGGGAGSAAPFAPVATALPVAQASARNVRRH